MMFKLDPASGHSDSYFDVEFDVEFEKCEEAVITFFNESSSEQLNIIGVTSGYIKNSNTAIVNHASKLKGHINIFNDDKMNNKFSLYGYVKIKCSIKLFNEEVLIHEDSSVLEFYNEAESLDAGILPFDFILHTKEINIEDNEPILIDIISGLDNKYEISIMSEDESLECAMQISCRGGKTSIHIPSEFAYYDLDLFNNINKKYKFYYSKIQGMSFSRLASRKHIAIENSNIKFIPPKYSITPSPQNRLSPSGKILDNSFTISDRYLVLCPSQYSGLKSKSSVSSQISINNVFLIHEGHNMKKINEKIKKTTPFSETGGSQGKIQETQKHIHDQKLREKSLNHIPNISMNQFQLLKSLSGNYNEISNKNLLHNKSISAVKLQQNSSNISTTFADNANYNPAANPKPIKNQGCSSCSRKHKNA